MGDAMRLPSQFDWRNQLGVLPPYAPKSMLEPAHAALLVIDMQHCSAGLHSLASEFLRLRYPHLHDVYFAQVAGIIPNVRRIISHFREQRRQVIYTTVSSN